MSKLTENQIAALTSACAREDGLAVLPTALKAEAASRVASKLIEGGLAREIIAKGDMPVWRNDGPKALSLKILKAGRAALQVMSPAREADQSASRKNKRAHSEQLSQTSSVTSPKTETKSAKILELLKRRQGASIEVLMEATGWQPHTTRAAVCRLRKAGAAISRTLDPKMKHSVYRIETSAIDAAA